MHIDDFTKNSIENLFEFWVHIIHGNHFFLHFTPNFGGAYYTKLHITHKPVHAEPTYSMFYYFSMQFPIRISDSLLLVIAASLWERQQCVISN